MKEMPAKVEAYYQEMRARRARRYVIVSIACVCVVLSCSRAFAPASFFCFRCVSHLFVCVFRSYDPLYVLLNGTGGPKAQKKTKAAKAPTA